jgi:hypothetical protein
MLQQDLNLKEEIGLHNRDELEPLLFHGHLSPQPRDETATGINPPKNRDIDIIFVLIISYKD